MQNLARVPDLQHIQFSRLFAVQNVVRKQIDAIMQNVEGIQGCLLKFTWPGTM